MQSISRPFDRTQAEVFKLVQSGRAVVGCEYRKAGKVVKDWGALVGLRGCGVCTVDDWVEWEEIRGWSTRRTKARRNQVYS